ncbi:pectate lyase 4 [Lactuca sativa]|uniref:pectate lyase 4 n=1 Tax=Lactuca sativa TaxID=4236 RepID=UPI000CD9B596|nr:pectate lyase 4 [Lactuca sativa]
MGTHNLILLFIHVVLFMAPGILSAGRRDVDESINQHGDPHHPELFAAEFGAAPKRRNLKACVAVNQIDKCWRCKADWADNRQALADCALGFGKGTTGGKGGDIYEVTDPSDDDFTEPKEGTLRWGVTRDRPLWITFAKDMVINLKQELVINNDKTIDGRGAAVEICNGGGLSVFKVKNVIIHGIHIHDIQETPGGDIKSNEGKAMPRSKHDGDGIMVFGSTNVWIDHCWFHDGPDGLIDVTMGSTMVTISNCKFSKHDKVMLLGADATHSEDKAMKVTLAYNKFVEGCIQRMPRCRWGLTQVVNNDFEKWGEYAIGGSNEPTILSQGNKYVAPDGANYKEVTRRAEATEDEWSKWSWKSENDVLENGATFKQSGGDIPITPEMITPDTTPVAELTADAGLLVCSPGTPC